MTTKSGISTTKRYSEITLLTHTHSYGSEMHITALDTIIRKLEKQEDEWSLVLIDYDTKAKTKKEFTFPCPFSQLGYLSKDSPSHLFAHRDCDLIVEEITFIFAMADYGVGGFSALDCVLKTCETNIGNYGTVLNKNEEPNYADLMYDFAIIKFDNKELQLNYI